MLEGIPDIGFFFIIIAFFGFYIKDAYNTGKYYDIPNARSNSIEIIFHYCSIAIFFLMGFFLLTYPIIINSSIVISNPNYQEIKFYFEFLNFTAVIFVISYFIATICGIYMRYFSYKFVYITFEENNTQITQKFNSIITIADNFVYCEKDEINNWKAIPINKISLIETKTEHETRYGAALKQKFPWIRTHSKKLNIALLISIIFFVGNTLFFQNFYIMIIFAIILLILGFLTVS